MSIRLYPSDRIDLVGGDRDPVATIECSRSHAKSGFLFTCSQDSTHLLTNENPVEQKEMKGSCTNIEKKFAKQNNFVMGHGAGGG